MNMQPQVAPLTDEEIKEALKERRKEARRLNREIDTLKELQRFRRKVGKFLEVEISLN